MEIWTEKYRPKSLDDMVMSIENRSYFSNINGIENNYLFLGGPGTGKNTLAYYLRDKFAPYTTLYINASSNNGIDTVRYEIENFLSSQSLLGNGERKLVILSEFDNFTNAAQCALREVMEQHLDTARFILTANYEHRIIDAIASRCQTFRFQPDLDAYKKRVSFVLKEEKIQGLKENLTFIRSLISKHFPDLRKVLNELQKYCKTGFLVAPIETESSINFAKKIWEMTKTDSFLALRTFVYQNEKEFGSDYHVLMRNLFDFAILDEDIEACSNIAEYMYRHSFVLDRELNFSGGLLTKLIKN